MEGNNNNPTPDTNTNMTPDPTVPTSHENDVINTIAQPAPVATTVESTPSQNQVINTGLQEPEHHSSKKPILISVIAIFILVLIAGGVYAYMTMMQPTPEPVVTAPVPAKTAAPVMTEQQILESELNAIDVGDIEKDMTEVDRDLNAL